MSTPPPRWLIEKLEADGTLYKGLTVRPTRRWCRCGASVIAFLDPLILRRVVLVDPWPTTSWGELAAVLTGRSTWELRFHGTDDRDRWDIRNRPADEYPVHVMHVCGDPSVRHPSLPERLVPMSDRPVDPPF